MPELSRSQEQFAHEYLKDEHPNATEAARRAGYKQARQRGHELVNKPHVWARIKELMEDRNARVNITKDDVLNDLQELRDKCLGRTPVTKLVQDKETGEQREVYYHRFDPQGAARSLELLGKHLQMFREVVDVTGQVSFEMDLFGQAAAASKAVEKPVQGEVIENGPHQEAGADAPHQEGDKG